MDRKKILVAGGAGFIGSLVNSMLHEAGYDTVVLDNLSTGSKEAVLKGKLIVGDIGDEELIKKIFREEKIDAVMHFAALIDVGESVHNPAKYYENNVVKTLTLLNAMVEFKVKHFIFSSSAAIFGAPQYVPVDENHPKNPINPYGKTKLMVEDILKDYSHAYGITFAALRYYNAAGGDPKGLIKNKKIAESNLIPVALRSLIKKSTLTIFGTDYPTKDGTCVRDYIHIADLGQAHILALNYLLNRGESAFFNLGNGQGYSVKEVVDTVEKVTKQKVKALEGKRREGDPALLLANSIFAERTLGWERRYPKLEEMIADAWNSYS